MVTFLCRCGHSHSNTGSGYRSAADEIVGRGLRICVNQDGERVHGFEFNTLTVMANESYEKFAEQLQKEIEQEEGIKFGVVEEHLFANIVIPVDDYTNEYLGVEASKARYSPTPFAPQKKPKSHAAKNTSKHWAMMLSSPSQMRSRILQGSTFNENLPYIRLAFRPIFLRPETL